MVRLRPCALLFAAACGGGSHPAPAAPVANAQPAPAPAPAAAPAPAPGAPASQNERLLTELDGFRAQMCACKTKPCAEQVSTAMTKWSQDLAATSKEPVNMSEDETKRVTDIAIAMGTCMQTAMGNGNGTTP